MFGSISRGWALTKTSFKVLKVDKEILALPLISSVFLVAVAAVFFVPLGLWVSRVGLDQVGQGPLFLAIFVFYVAAYFIIIFFNAATIEMATIRFNGGAPVLMDGIRKSSSKWVRILQWAVVAATVGLILKILDNAARQSRDNVTRIVGEIAVSIAGAAWNIATFFVVPVLVYQDLGPFQAIRTSVGTWRRTWGEGATAVFTTGIIFFLLALVGLVPLWIGFAAGGALLIAMIALVLVYWILLWAVQTAVDGIVVAALYKYAVDGRLPEVFQDTPLPGVTPTSA